MQGNSSSKFDVQYDPSRKTKILLMGLLLVLNVIIRIPSVPHEKGYDSFIIHTLANSVSIFNSARWWLNWLSVFGLYPDSYASAVPFTLSGISQVLGIEMEKAILLFCVSIGIFGMFTAYIFAGLVHKNFLFKYIMSLFYSIAPGFMLFTTWEVSTRGQFLVFLPLFLYILLKKDLKVNKCALLSICLIFIFATHHYAYFLLPITVSYISLKVIQKIKPEYLKNPYLNHLFLLVFVAVIIYPFFTGLFIPSGSRYAAIIGSIITNIRQTGPLIFLLPGGLVYLFLSKKNFEEIFMCSITIILAPIFYSQIYGPFILLIMCVFLVSIAFNNLLKIIVNHKHKLLILSAIIAILFLATFSSFYNHYRTGQSDSFWYMEESTYASGIWAKNHIPGDTYGLDSGMETGRFFAISEGHPIITSDDPINLAYGWINESDIHTVKNSPKSLEYYFDGPYSIESGTTFSGSIEWIKYTTKNIESLKEFDYFIQDKYDYKPVVDVVKRESNLIFDGTRISIWEITNEGMD
ncbi:hypothetical protein MSSIH_2957 [Methanosarcina siciliae HI350]|uniref:Glycosyltransferase RgtA/B/C/D-like domain-containing protein n=1 Tax=Methanosarcina siciliae HI350 TaxID=1434119 RepID=A0A0E3PHT4_9EURY|nr:hypothetical protein [Methanosarcina siciliae]AKB33647.1 hypothetical protein MSSIH_2957 [Methanosarcina siciliae HI350]